MFIAIMFILASFTMFIENANAYYVISENDPNSIIMNPHRDTSADTIRMNYASGRVKSHKINFYRDKEYTILNTSTTHTSTTHFVGVGLTCVGFYEVTAFGDSGEVLAKVRVAVEEGDLVAPRCSSGGDEEDPPPPEPEPEPEPPAETCDSCAVFSCPGWGKYMDKLDEIKAAIPPPPNWQHVSEVFRDTIAPRIKADLQDVIGVAPEPVMPAIPRTPDIPSAPEIPMPNAVSLEPPTGQEAPGLGDSVFTPADIKSEAPVIEERGDPTGGFNIVDPVGALPSQEEFIKNVPREGEAPLPGAPAEPDNVAPMPGDTGDSPPVPGDTNNTAPVPGESGNAAPIPNESMTAPLPDGDSSKAPIPGDSTQFTAPTP